MSYPRLEAPMSTVIYIGVLAIIVLVIISLFGTGWPAF
jgi:hypothetical protein